MGFCLLRQRRQQLSQYHDQVRTPYNEHDRCDFKRLVSVNGGASVLLDMPDTSSSERLLSQPVKLRLSAGANNLTFGAGQRSEFAMLPALIDY
jgi:hypothetical protein